jgi:hypothetical protein
MRDEKLKTTPAQRLLLDHCVPDGRSREEVMHAQADEPTDGPRRNNGRNVRGNPRHGGGMEELPVDPGVL